VKVLSYSQRMKITDSITRANNTGQDVAEYLHRYGLIATPQWAARIKAEAIGEFISYLEGASLADVIGDKYRAGSWTADDVLRGVITKLRNLEQRTREGEQFE
jgi:hypothetical protein